MTSGAHRLAHAMRQVGWLAICGWLLLCLAGEAMYLARWLAERDAPGAHELLLGVSLAALWAMPAVLLVIAMSWLPGFRDDRELRRAAWVLATIALVLWGAAVIAAHG
ncbi:hypothetical protein [Luteitalea sp.]